MLPHSQEKQLEIIVSYVSQYPDKRTHHYTTTCDVVLGKKIIEPEPDWDFRSKYQFMGNREARRTFKPYHRNAISKSESVANIIWLFFPQKIHCKENTKTVKEALKRDLRAILTNVWTLFGSQFKLKTIPQMNVLYYPLICSPKEHSKTWCYNQTCHFLQPSLDVQQWLAHQAKYIFFPDAGVLVPLDVFFLLPTYLKF